MTWPACVICGEPVELDEHAVLRRRRIEHRVGEEIPGYRVPEDVHAGRCLQLHDARRAREAIARSAVPDAPRLGEISHGD